MKKLTVLILFVLSSFTFAIAQSQWQWAQEHGISSVVTDLSVANGIDFSKIDNSIVTVGNFSNATGGGATFGCTYLTSTYANTKTDMFLTKTDALTGNCMLATYAGGSKDDRGNAVAVSTTGDIFMVGRAYNNALAFWGASGTSISWTSPTINTSTFLWSIARYDMNLEPIWSAGYGSYSTDAEAKAVTYDNVNNLVYVAGMERSKFGMIARINPNNSGVGNWWAWLKGIGGASDVSCTGIEMSDDGSVLACGYFKGTMEILNGSNINNLAGSSTGIVLNSIGGSYDYFVVKYRSDGSFIWYATGGGSGEDKATGIISNENGTFSGVYVTGTFDSPSITFNSANTNPINSITLNGFGDKDIFICTYASGSFYNPNGALSCANVFGTSGEEISNSISYRYHGNPNTNFTGPVITGTLRSSNTNVFDPNCNTPLNIGAKNIFVCKLDQHCSPIDSWWHNIVNAPNGVNTTSNSISTDRLGNFFIAGGYDLVANTPPHNFKFNAANILGPVPIGARHAFDAKIQSLAMAGPDLSAPAPVGTPALITSNIAYNWSGYECPSYSPISYNQAIYNPSSIGNYQLFVQAMCSNDAYTLSSGYEFDQVYVGPACRIANPNVSATQSPTEFSIFPNPNNGQFDVSFVNDESMVTDISIYDIAGRMVYQYPVESINSDKIKIDLPSGMSGVYSVQITTTTQKYYSKIVVQE